MTAPISKVQKGDRFVWQTDDGDGHDQTVYIEVLRIARDGSWADIRCLTWATGWTKRQRLPLPEGSRPYAWTQEDLDRDAENRAATDGGSKPYGAGNPQCPARDAAGLDCAGPAGHPDGSNHANINGTWPAGGGQRG